MSQLLGLLNIAEAAAERTYVNTIGQRVVYDAVRMVIDQYNRDLNAAVSMFVERDTTDWKFRYKLPGAGRLQRRGGQAQSGAVKATGSWDVAIPLEDFGAQVGGDDIALAYMTAAEMNRHIQTVTIQNTNTVRHEILRAMLNSAQRTFADDIAGSLTVEPLANGDSVVYPPVLGSEAEATEDHYYGVNYITSAISDTNNPIYTIVQDLEEHYGDDIGCVVFINPTAQPYVEALADFDEVPDRYIRPGDDTAVPFGMPSVPGKIIGRCSGAWVSVWRWIPDGYMLGINTDMPSPLMRRIDPPDTGLKPNLTLVAKSDEYPLESSHYRNRFGYAVTNRLGGVAIQLVASTTYTTPTAYA